MSKEIKKATPRAKAPSGAKKAKAAASKSTTPKTQKAPKAAKVAAASKRAPGAGAPKTPGNAAGAAKKASGKAAIAAGVGSVKEKATSFDARAFIISFKVPLAIVAAVLILIAALYGPARGYYSAWRTNGILQATHERETAEGEQLESDVNALMTEEGIKDEARKKGYVDEGELRLEVEGIDTEGKEEEPEVEETPWYLLVTDFIFQYSEE